MAALATACPLSKVSTRSPAPRGRCPATAAISAASSARQNTSVVAQSASRRRFSLSSSSAASFATPIASPARRLARAAPRRASLVARAESSYIMVKPDGVQRGLVGEIIGRLERKGFKLTALKMFVPPRSLAEEHYKDLSSKPFFGDLVTYICSGPVVAMVWEGDGVVASARKLIGATNPLAAEPGTIRGDFAIQTGRNVVHGSDSPENGEREAALWFGGGESRCEWRRAVEPWLVE